MKNGIEVKTGEEYLMGNYLVDDNVVAEALFRVNGNFLSVMYEQRFVRTITRRLSNVK